MSSKHTPGPWAVHDHPTDPNQFGHHVTTVDGLTICSVTYQLPVQTAKGAKEATRVANARLIAAAPELLAALVKAERLFREIGFIAAADSARPESLWNEINNAIAKATDGAQ
ncbi:hypothetical protein ACSMEB_08310 [Stenotrophomonas maltophilia]|uniref:hypothetical protein n=1 Tax=Stenotrophomonas maltophilia TaxID=40324 RepID=UPI0021C8C4CB|nr:hypothetical protein [Stenotrophomonas maltophilia]MCU1200014.1 hypothetical protein [Stenotrophomonas maltophilia]